MPKSARFNLAFALIANATRTGASGEVKVGTEINLDSPDTEVGYAFTLGNLDASTATGWDISSGTVTTAGGSTVVDNDVDFEGRAIAGAGGIHLFAVVAPASNTGLVNISHPYFSGKVEPGGLAVFFAPNGGIGGSDTSTPVQFTSASGADGCTVYAWTP